MDEYRDLLAAAGFGDLALTRTKTPMVILPATAMQTIPPSARTYLCLEDLAVAGGSQPKTLRPP